MLLPHNQHKKRIREIVEIVEIVGKSSWDITTILLGSLQKGIVDNTISTAAGL